MRQLLLFLSLLALSFSGCQTPAKTKVWVEQLEQEIRDKEDYIFDLESENERLCHELERFERKQASGKLEASPRPERSSIFTPRKSEKSTPPVPPDVLQEPKIEIEGLGVPGNELPPTRPAAPKMPSIVPRPTPAAPLELPGLPGGSGASKGSSSLKPSTTDELPAPADAPSPKVAPQVEELDPNVNHIKVNPTHTTGYDVDGSPGDDGIKVLIEPRNKEERFVPLPAPVSIVVLDPAAEGAEQRLARWDFTSKQVDDALQAALPEQGLMFQLPWTKGTPQHNKLQVCVRYVTPSGKKLETRHDLYVSLPGQISQRWTPATNPRRAVAQEAPPTATPASLETPVSEAPAAPTPTAATLPAESPAESPAEPPVAPPKPDPVADRRPIWRPFR